MCVCVWGGSTCLHLYAGGGGGGYLHDYRHFSDFVCLCWKGGRLCTYMTVHDYK